MIPDAPSDPPLKRLQLLSGPVTWTDEGEGLALVCLHGLPGSVRDFRWLAPAVGPGVRTIRVDLPGFGGTPLGTWRGSKLPARADFVCAVLDELDLGPVILLGHSMGGAVAAAVAARRPDVVSGLALLCSIGTRPHRGMKKWSVPPRLVSLLLRVGPVRRRALAELRRAFHAAGFKGHKDASLLQTVHCVAGTSLAQHQRNLRSLSCPTMVVWTQDDPLIETSISEQLASICPAGPRLVFAAGGHNPQKACAIELGRSLVDFANSIHAENV